MIVHKLLHPSTVYFFLQHNSIAVDWPSIVGVPDEVDCIGIRINDWYYTIVSL